MMIWASAGVNFCDAKFTLAPGFAGLRCATVPAKKAGTNPYNPSRRSRAGLSRWKVEGGGWKGGRCINERWNGRGSK